MQRRTGRRAARSGLHQDLEAAVGHALDVEGHVLRIAHCRQSGVFHHPGVDPVAVRARLEANPGEHDRLAGLELDPARKRRPHLHREVLAHAFPEFEGAVLPPDLPRLPGEAAVGLQLLPGHRQDIAIYVSHVNSPHVYSLRSGWEATAWAAISRIGRTGRTSMLPNRAGGILAAS